MASEVFISYRISKPSLSEYHMLRDAFDWRLHERGISDERAQRSIDASPLIICAYHDSKIVGMVRLAGDLEMYGYIQDTMVLPEYQRMEIGTKMMQLILNRIEILPGYLLGVCPSRSSVSFYAKLGFKQRPEYPNGFMYKQIGDFSHEE